VKVKREFIWDNQACHSNVIMDDDSECEMKDDNSDSPNISWQEEHFSYH
jgi:hypothetical protein